MNDIKRNQQSGILGVGEVTLGVADVERMVQFYREIIGLRVLDRNDAKTTLGVAGRPLVVLLSRPGAAANPRSPGLFHLALLLPGRPQLGQWLRHLVDAGYPLEGAGDHLVSEALYLRDPEGNGIEIYRDRSRAEWTYNGDQIDMATLPVDYRSLLDEAGAASFEGLPDDTAMGHVHLQVSDLERAVAFYRDEVGLDVMAYMPGAGFLSAGGYHHHLGMNTWHSRGASPPPEGALGLVDYVLLLDSETALQGLRDRLNPDTVHHSRSSGELVVQDADGITITARVA